MPPGYNEIHARFYSLIPRTVWNGLGMRLWPYRFKLSQFLHEGVHPWLKVGGKRSWT